jgi:hypothetical protein
VQDEQAAIAASVEERSRGIDYEKRRNTMSVNEAAIRKMQGEYEHQVSLLPDLTDAEQKEVVAKCVAYFKNNEGVAPSPQGVINLAHGVRSRRAGRKEAADWQLENLKQRSAAWMKQNFPEVN